MIVFLDFRGEFRVGNRLFGFIRPACLQVTAAGWAVDFNFPLRPAANGTDVTVFGRTKSLSGPR
jgi:hypothetical protein